MKVKAVLCILAVLLVLPCVAVAQDEDLTEYVLGALEAMMAQKSYHAEMDQSIEQSIVMTVEGETINILQTITQVGAGQARVTGAGKLDLSMTSTQEITQEFSLEGMPSMDIAQTIELVVLDDTVYARFSDVSGVLAGTLPEGWVDLSAGDAYPGADFINWKNFATLLDLEKTFPITVDSIGAVVELDPDAIDGREVRVFDVGFDFSKVEDLSGMFDDMVDPSALGVDIDMDTFWDTLIENLDTTYTMWIGVEDGLVYRVDSTTSLTIDLDIPIPNTEITAPMYIEQTSVSSNTYSDFGAPVEIEAPVLEE